MAAEELKDCRFGSIAVELNLIDQAKVDKALVVQARIHDKTGVDMPIGEILIEMGVISAAERDDILRVQREMEEPAKTEKNSAAKNKKGKNGQDSKDAGLEISVAKDKLTVTVKLNTEVELDEEITLNDVKLILHREGVIYGIADDALITAFLEGEVANGQAWTIATGTEPIPDTPPEIRYHFDTNPMKIGTLTEDGRMDWKDRGKLPQVKEGALLAEKIPGPKGKEGMDVFGKKIPIPKTREVRMKTSKGAKRSEDGMQVHASLAGMPKLSRGGEISVLPTLHIQGDIGLKTGHVEFDGHIEVEGAIEKGYQVKGGSLRAAEIQAANIDIDGDITAMTGIFGATIRSTGNLKAGHINNADIVARGDIAVEREIIESQIEANGRVMIPDGIIIASTISAKMGITSMDIGTEASRPSELTVGIDRELERQAASIRAEIKPLKTEQDELIEEIQKLKKRSDDINTRLGEVAQLQDQCMVKHRNIQAKLDACKTSPDKDCAEKLHNAMQDLQSKQDAYDKDVTQLMEEDETIGEQIEEIKHAFQTNARTIEELNDNLKVVVEAQKTSTGLAIIKIAGRIFSGTSITGPHTKLIQKEDLKRLNISETDSPDANGARRWRFELTPFR